MDLSMGNASAHLQTLKEAPAGRVAGRALRSLRLADESVADLLQSMRSVAERRLAEMVDRLVKTYLSERRSLESIGF